MELPYTLALMDYTDNLDEAQQLAKMINSKFARQGIKAKFVTMSDKNGTKYYYLSFMVNPDKPNRNAGRKKVYGNSMTVAEVKEMQKTMTADEISKALGISRSTFYRRLQNVDKMDKYFI